MRGSQVGKLLVLAVAAVCVGSPAARADILPASVAVSADGGNFRYSYGINLESGSKVKVGDFFQIYDFSGFAGGIVAPKGWTGVMSTNAPPPNFTTPAHNPALPILTFTFIGDNNVSSLTGSLGVGTFSALSSSGQTTAVAFASRYHKVSDGEYGSSVTTTLGPAGSVSKAPEPATLALLGIGLPCLGLARVLRRRKQNADE